MVSDRNQQGRITKGIIPGTTILKTLEFVHRQLSQWRDMPDRPAVTSEEELNGQLCKYLNAEARKQSFAMAYFHHEEKQTGRRRVDLSALPPSPTVIESRNYSILEPFLVLEGKRLPSPSTDRQREYVTGFDKKSGGIQRFKLGLHGALLNHAGMIGYVQKESFDHWINSINSWIADLAKSTEEWSSEEYLDGLETNSTSGSASCTSQHKRVESKTSRIHLTHMWIDMQ